MQLTTALQSLLAMAMMAPSVLGSPVATTTNALEERDGAHILKRSYFATCDNCKLYGNGDFTCRCNKTNGDKVQSTLNLNSCIVNVNGVVQWRKGGGFLGSCWYLHYQPSEALMTAGCNTRAGTTLYSQLNLDANIHNINGALQCHV